MADDFRQRMELKLELMRLYEESGFSREGTALALNVTLGQLRGWLSGREQVEAYLQSGQVPTSNTNAPSDHIVEKLKNEIRNVRLDLAHRVLQNARNKEAIAPLTRQEFEHGWKHVPNADEPNVAHQIAGNASEEIRESSGKHYVPVIGRSGTLGFVSSTSGEHLLETAWLQYQAWLRQSPYSAESFDRIDFIEKFLKAKQQYRDLFTAFNLTHPEVSRIMSLGVEPDEDNYVQTKGRSMAASFATYAYPRFPPKDMVYVLQRALQSWAADTLHSFDVQATGGEPNQLYIPKPEVPVEELMHASTYMLALNSEMIKKLKAITSKHKIDPARYTELPEVLATKL